MKDRKLHSKKEHGPFRKMLRSNLTPAEAFLWKHLKARSFAGRRFTKQHSIKNYIVDFYCASEKLIIELDGEAHNNPAAIEYDEQRTELLTQLGYHVLRFENKMVFGYLESVLKEIKGNFKNK